MLMMMCAGASEQAVSQWASTFAERGLRISKTMGDLLGPTCFAALMGLSRVFYGKYGDKIDLEKFDGGCSAMLCVAAYLLISLTNQRVAGAGGRAACAALSVGIMLARLLQHCG